MSFLASLPLPESRQIETCPTESGLIDLLERISTGLTRRTPALRITRLRVLSHVSDCGRRGAAQVDLAQALRLSSAVVSRMCDALERDGLITRDSHPMDRRKKSVRLTEGGRRQLAACGQATGFDTITAALSPLEMERLNALLTRIAAGLSSPTRPAACRQCRIGGC